MRRLITALTIGALSTGLVIAPAIANPSTHSASAKVVSHVIGERFEVRSDSCLNPGAHGSPEYGINVVGYAGDKAVTKGVIELIDGNKRIRVTPDIDAESLEHFSAAYYRFQNPKHLNYQITLDGIASPVYAGYKGDVSNPAPSNTPVKSNDSTKTTTKVAAKSTKVTVKNTKVAATSNAARKTVLTVSNPAGRTLTVQNRVKGSWKTVQKVRLSNKATQKVAVKTTAAAKKTGKHQYRVVIKGTAKNSGVTKAFTVKTVKVKQKTSVKVIAKKNKTVFTVKSSVKSSSKVTLQKKVGKKWKKVASKSAPKASAKFTVKKAKGTYRVVVKSTKGLTTTTVKTVRVR